MKRKNLLLIILSLIYGLSGFSQDTIKSLIFSEVRMDEKWNAYVELTNMGTEAVDLGLFSMNSTSSSIQNGFLASGSNREFYLPNVMLEPGESYVISNSFNLLDILHATKPDVWNPYTKPEMRKLADVLIECKESEIAAGEDQTNELVSVAYDALWSFGGKGSYFLEWHSADGTDSAAVDAINCIFDVQGKPLGNLTDVAGITGAPNTHVLIRKANVTKGNLDWNLSRGTDIIDSEWLPVPIGWPDVSADYERDPYWTVGNHGDFNLDANTLVSVNPEVTVNFAEKTITVPWGIRNNDSIMHQFERKSGVSWFYKYSPEKADSAFISARNGDSLFVYVTGNDLDIAGFKIIVNDPLAGDNIVVPMNKMNYSTFTYQGYRANPFNVTDGLPMDTIYNVPFQTRSDTLLKYLEKAPLATWEIIYINNEVRADLKNGDKLKVAAQNGNTKEYFIKIGKESKSSNGQLASITWPDIPEFYKGLYGWVGDTIPGFGPANYTLNVYVPWDYDGIPAFVAKAQHVNTKIVMQRARSLSGEPDDRTVVITTTAPDDTSVFVYKILLTKEKDPVDIQKWEAEPFLSQWSHREQGSDGAWNSAWEITNPGTEMIDLKNYMFCKGYGTPAEVIGMWTGWTDRYKKYIPGMQWADSIDWDVKPGIFVADPRVNSLVYGGDNFVMGSAGYTNAPEFMPYHWAEDRFDVNFKNPDNPWHVDRKNMSGTVIDSYGADSWWLFKIVGDSVVEGLKPATDPNDFLLIDCFGMGVSDPKWNYMNSITGTLGNDHKRVHIRKPHIYLGNTVPGSMFSLTSADSSEWMNYKAPNDLYQFANGNYSWATRYNCGWDLGLHTLNEVTIYQSIVSSNAYIVSSGFSMSEEIKGVVTGTNVADFLANIIKKDENQTIVVKNSAGTVITGTAIVDDNSVLVVTSADGVNTSSYVLDVTPSGLSNDALLTSTVYSIQVDGTTGSISGMATGTNLSEVIENITVPFGASLTATDKNDAYLPLKVLNFDTLYVDVKVINGVFFEVIAEDKVTKVIYEVKPVSDPGEAFVYSSVYLVDQDSFLIDVVPGSTSVETFIKNLYTSTGATLKVLDKFGSERTSGNLYLDDVVQVISSDETKENVYYLGLSAGSLQLSSLAYVVSDVYSVDQIEKTIEGGITTELTVTDFMTNLTTSRGAHSDLIMASGAVKTSLNLENGDMVKVTAENGVNVVYYSINITIIGIDSETKPGIHVYPNPTTDIIYVKGVQTGSKVSIYNSTGKLVKVINVNSDLEEIQLGNQPAGIYYLNIDTNGSKSVQHKLMKL